MTGAEALVNWPVAQAIGWALVHFTWQGTAIAALAGLTLAALHRSAPDVRYVVSAIALALMATLPVATAVQVWTAATGADSLAVGGDAAEPVFAPRAAAVPDAEAAAPATPGGWTPPFVERPRVEPWLPVFVLAWASGVALLTLRLLTAWLLTRRLTHQDAVPAGDGWQIIAARLSKRLHIRRPVRLLQSGLVQVPTVIGWLKPVVLLPIGMLVGLSPRQVEAILAHELAHVRRHDYLVNMLQALVETLLFYHPAVWWLSRRIRAEREHCCDDLAVDMCGDPYMYARALADLEDLRGTGGLALAATDGSLLQRVGRLLGAPSHAGREPGWLAGTAAILLMLGIAAGAAATEGTPIAGTATPGEGPQVTAATVPEASDVPAGRREGDDRQKPPAPPEPPAPPPPAAFDAGTRQQSGTFVWTSDGKRLEIQYRGEVEFSPDETDVVRMSPGGFIKMSDSRFFGGQTVEFRADASGAISRRYWAGMRERPYEPDGQAWVAESLPRFIRQSGLGASARVARILSASGPAGVLAEISQIDGSWAKRRYFDELLKAARLEPAMVRRVLEQAGLELKSDHELASLLISRMPELFVDGATRKAYVEAAGAIASDHDMRRVFSSALQAAPADPGLLASVLEASHDIGSDHELASLLIQVAKEHALDGQTRAPFFAALATVGSDHERGRVLSALAARTDLDGQSVEAMLDAAAGISSDHEAASFLLRVVRQIPLGAVAAPFFRVVDTLSSSYERGRVLQAVLKRGDASGDVLVAVLRAVAAMGGAHDAGQVLHAAASGYRITGEARSLYMAAAERLGEYDRNRALAALVRAESR